MSAQPCGMKRVRQRACRAAAVACALGLSCRAATAVAAPAAAPKAAATAATGVPARVRQCLELRKHGEDARAGKCFSALAGSGSAYLRAEGYWGLRQYQDANREFRAAVAQADGNALYRTRWGLLLHERFNDADAVGLFKEALQRDPKDAEADLGLAQVSADGFDDQAVSWARKALQADPQLAAAHELLAGIALEDSDPVAAAVEADAALKISGESVDAMAIHASIELLAERPADAWWARIQAINPHYGEGYAIAAHHLILNRRYRDGIAWYRKALDLSPQLWPARAQLGINLMRLGEDEEARQQLTQCYDNGYRDAATVNSLRLLDSLKNFVTLKDATTILKLNKKEADLLYPYFHEVLTQSIAVYEKKYRMKLAGPVQVEVYPDHEDFAVRTLGMPGLGALGVTFGQVVAMDSPSGRKPGDFHWASTLRHELSHVFILAATDHRVPRWFTEGLAVHEETQASPEWGDPMTPDIVVALRDKKLLPVAQLDRGFIEPQFDGQVLVSYFEAGRICDYIQSRWSADKLLDIVHQFAIPRMTTPQAIQATLGMSTQEFDKQFQAWLYADTAAVVGGFDEWHKRLTALVAAARAGKNAEVIREGGAVIDLYPDYVYDANAYELLARAQLAAGNKAAAAEVLQRYVHRGGRRPETLEQLATLQQDLGRPRDAAATLDRINYIDPAVDPEFHRRLGELWLAQKNYAGAEREFGAVLAMQPLDPAQAHFDLARAYFAAGLTDKATDAVLESLTAAPNFRPAQKLLLQLKGQ